ncbi:hypothetical protein BGX34_009617 [Mortierella sp. NVP85]|nr:hypothetical protein BGX34_009617 [Mortierella sp. NVP85]
MAYDSPSPAASDHLAPSLCLNPDAIEDIAPVQPTEQNLLPASFPTLAWSELSFSEYKASKSEKKLCYRHRPDLRAGRAADEIQLEELQRVCKSWKRLADDNVVWHRMCEQHIGLKCTKCGWGLPLLKKKSRGRRPLEQQQQQRISHSQDSQDESDSEVHPHTSQSATLRVTETISSLPSPPHQPSQELSVRRRSASSEFDDGDRQAKRARHSPRSPSPGCEGPSLSPLFQQPEPPVKSADTVKRLWKDIYSERLIVERNWRKRNYKMKEFRGHTDGVMCLQFDESFLITGSYDNTVKVWNVETGECLRTLAGHVLCVRALHFDEAKLITGSMDRTLKIWNYHTGQCIRTLQGHTDGVVTLDFDSRVLASGSVDSTIKIWNFATGECTTLTGHSDLVNKVQLYKKTMLFSASDDMTVKLWNITTRTCTQTLTGHIGRVQSLQTSGDALISILTKRRPNRSRTLDNGQHSPAYDSGSSDSETRTMMPIVITGALDNTLKVWNAETGDYLRTLFGHENGVWSLAFDKLRIVSGSLDRTIKVWDTESGDCLYTLSGLDGPVTCVGLGDTRVVGGSANGAIVIWDFGAQKGK